MSEAEADSTEGLEELSVLLLTEEEEAVELVDQEGERSLDIA
jgi:hypothetical protein